MRFEQGKTAEQVGFALGFALSFCLFTTMLCFILNRFISVNAWLWTAAITLSIVLVGSFLQWVLK